MNNTVNADKNPGGVGDESPRPALDDGSIKTMSPASHARMIQSWLNSKEPDLARRAIMAHVAALSGSALELQAISEVARDFIWEPENWEAYELSKRSDSVAWSPEFLLLAQAVEKKYGAMPLDEPCEICHAKTVATHDPDCPNNPVWDSRDEPEREAETVQAKPQE